MSEYIINNYHGKSIIDTYHSFDRFEERNELTKKDILSWFKRIIDYFNTHDYLEEGNRILVYSPKLDQGVVFHYRKDGKTNKLAYIMIILVLSNDDQQAIGMIQNQATGNPGGCPEKRAFFKHFCNKFVIFFDSIL